MKVIAEGAETDTQLQFLIEQECQFAQGYYLAKPMPEQEVQDLMRQRPEFLSLVEHNDVTTKAE
ncbi:MAG: EAL domain-containing protein [Proteobacteria bacterium]|nr:MAG: EAL domain-containing protein [Pseudomonadota bacterium]